MKAKCTFWVWITSCCAAAQRDVSCIYRIMEVSITCIYIEWQSLLWCTTSLQRCIWSTHTYSHHSLHGLKITTCLVSLFLIKSDKRSHETNRCCVSEFWIETKIGFQFHNRETSLGGDTTTERLWNRVKLSISLPICLQNTWCLEKDLLKCTLKRKKEAISLLQPVTTAQLKVCFSGEVKQGTQYALWFNGPQSARWWEKKKRKKREGRKRFWSHGHEVILKVCWHSTAHRKYKSFTVSDRVHATSIIFRGLSQAAASGWWIQNRRRAGDESKNGKWKHVSSLSRQFLKGEQTKTGQQGHVVVEKISESKHFLLKLVCTIYGIYLEIHNDDFQLSWNFSSTLR